MFYDCLGRSLIQRGRRSCFRYASRSLHAMSATIKTIFKTIRDPPKDPLMCHRHSHSSETSVINGGPHCAFVMIDVNINPVSSQTTITTSSTVSFRFKLNSLSADGFLTKNV